MNERRKKQELRTLSVLSSPPLLSDWCPAAAPQFRDPSTNNHSPPSPATLDESCCAILRNKTSTRLPDSLECKKKKPLPWQLLPALSPSLSQIPGEKPNKAAVMSCQDFNEQFPQTPSCAETRPSRCTVSSVCCSLVQTAAGTAILPLNHHSSGEVALFGKENRRGERFARDVYTVLLRG